MCFTLIDMHVKQDFMVFVSIKNNYVHIFKKIFFIETSPFGYQSQVRPLNWEGRDR